MENKKNRFILMGIFIGTFVVLMMQFSTVMVYFDDYGYYSLSYGVSGYASTPEFAYNELLVFLREHYLQWNGRLLGFFVWLSLYFIGGLGLVQFAAAITVTALLYLLWRIVNHRQQILSALLICSFYGLFSLRITTSGVYWFAAFFHYVAPLLAIVGVLMLYFKYRAEGMTAGKQISLVLLIICAGFSQEQLSVTVAFMFTLILFFELTQKNFKVVQLLYWGVSIACVAVLFLSPGIHNRVGTEARPLLLQIVESTYFVIHNFFAGDNVGFVVLLYVAVLGFSVKLYRSETCMILKLMDLGAIVLAIISMIAFVCSPIRTLLGALALNRYYALIAVGVPVITLVVLQIMRYYYVEQSYERLILFCTAVASVGCLCVLPELHVRLLLPGWFLLFPLLIDGIFCVVELCSAYKKELANVCVGGICAAVLLYAAVNMTYIYRGYAINKITLTENDTKIAQAVADGENAVYLKVMPYPDHAGAQPYTEHVSAMKNYMIHYFGMDESFRLYYNETGENTIPEQEYIHRGNDIYIAVDSVE